jgi:hypothetical protein
MKAIRPYKPSKTEKESMLREIRKQIAIQERDFVLDVDATVLWTLHECFGFGKDRLRKFFEEYSKTYRDLLSRYEMDNEDAKWLYRHMLKYRLGIDIEAWNKESEKGGVQG